MSHLRIDPARADELIAAFRDRAGLVDGFDGFEGLEVWRSDREPGEVIMVSRWRDRACFADYMRSEAHRISHDRIAPDLQANIKLERLDHLHTLDLAGTVDLDSQVGWLGRVLSARGYPLESLADDLATAAAVVRREPSSDALRALGDRLAAAGDGLATGA